VLAAVVRSDGRAADVVGSRGAAVVDGERSVAGEPTVAGGRGPAAWVSGFASGTAVGQAAGEAEPVVGHSSPVFVIGPSASRTLAAVAVVAKARVATTAPVTITPSTAHPRPWLRAA
jgi:hypothetical protein